MGLQFNMAASVLRGRGLLERMQSMADQTDVEMAKEDHGQMMSTGFQGNVDFVQPPATAVYRSRITGADTMAVPQIDEDKNGVPSLQTFTRTKCGGTAGEEEVREPFVTCLKSLVLAERPSGDGISTKRQEDARCSFMAAVGEMLTTLEPRVNVNRNV